MKLPLESPDLSNLSDSDNKLIDKISAHSSPTDSKGRYLHWDRVRHLKPPEGLTSKQWWTGIKLSRMDMSKSLPLQSEQEQPFTFCMIDSILKDLRWLDRNAAGQMLTATPVINSDIRSTYLIKSLVEEAINSSQLEGASTTRNVAKAMIREQRTPNDKSEQMILNNYHAMQFIRDYKDENLTPSIVFELHKIITEKTLNDPDKAGVFREKKDDIRVVDSTSAIIYTPPDPSCLKERLDWLCEFANKTFDSELIHPVIKAIILHFMLAYDHPFVDGNGRTSRALFYWSMIKQGYWLTEFISISRIIKLAPIQYGRAFLHTETDDNDLTYFIIHQLEVIKKAIRDLNAYLEKKSSNIEYATNLLDNAKNLGRKLNFRQRYLLRHALKHPRFIYTISEYQSFHGISYETARKDLLHMSDTLKLLSRSKDSRSFVFMSPSDLENRIKKC
ncbi:Fic family protein [Desulfobacterales bacterium HSG16]|nr:Fic family protein [Desulfobacterales bacterium HSG16]